MPVTLGELHAGIASDGSRSPCPRARNAFGVSPEGPAQKKPRAARRGSVRFVELPNRDRNVHHRGSFFQRVGLRRFGLAEVGPDYVHENHDPSGTKPLRPGTSPALSLGARAMSFR